MMMLSPSGKAQHLTAAFAGSSPASPVLDNFIRVCSSGGRALDFNQVVRGSNPPHAQLISMI